MARHRPGRFTRSFIFNLNQCAGWNFDGDRTFSGGNVNMHWTWKNYYTSGFGVNFNAAPFRDRITRGGPASSAIASSRVAQRGTDSRKALSFNYNGYHETDRQGTTRHQHRSLRQLAADVGRVGMGSVSATTSITTMRSG